MDMTIGGVSLEQFGQAMERAGQAFSEVVVGLLQDSYHAGRIAALREACERTCPKGTIINDTCGTEFRDGEGRTSRRATCTLHLMLAEEENSGHSTV